MTKSKIFPIPEIPLSIVNANKKNEETLKKSNKYNEKNNEEEGSTPQGSAQNIRQRKK